MASYEYRVEVAEVGGGCFWTAQERLDNNLRPLPWDANSAKMACHLELGKRYRNQPSTQFRVQRRRAASSPKGNPGPWETHRRYVIGEDGILRRTDR